MDEEPNEASDLNPDDPQISDSDTISELVHTQEGVKMMILRMDLRLKNSARQAANMTLSCEMKSLRQTLNGSNRLVDELVYTHQACTEMDATIRSQGRCITKMKLENQALKAQIENNNWEKSMIIEDLIFCGEEHLLTIEELRTHIKQLEVQMEKAMPHVYVPVEVSDVLEAEEEQDPNVDVQTKSWLRRQADKVLKGMGTFCLQFKGCFGGRTRKRHVVQPVDMDMHTAMPPVSDGMPPVSI